MLSYYKVAFEVTIQILDSKDMTILMYGFITKLTTIVITRKLVNCNLCVDEEAKQHFKYQVHLSILSLRIRLIKYYLNRLTLLVIMQYLYQRVKPS